MLLRPLFNAFLALAKGVGMLCVPLLLVTASLQIVVQNPWLYQYGFRAYNIPEVTGIAYEQLLSAAEQTRAYFRSEDEPLRVTVEKDGKPIELYNAKEVQHMADVKVLMQRADFVREMSFSFLLGLLGLGLWIRKAPFFADMLDVMMWGGVLTVGLMLGVGISALVGFEQIFLQFHYLSFSNNLWLLDPTRDYLIMMYPQGFFRDATIAIGGLTLLLALLCWFGGAALLGRLRPRPGRPQYVEMYFPPEPPTEVFHLPTMIEVKGSDDAPSPSSATPPTGVTLKEETPPPPRDRPTP